MSETSVSLIEQLRRTDNDAWARLLDLYAPLIRGWLGRNGLRHEDIDDVTQEVLTVVFRRLPDFDRQPRAGAFRCWLRTITANCLRDFWGRQKGRPRGSGGGDVQAMLEQLADPDSGLSKAWDQEHDLHVFSKLLQLIRPRFEATTWEAFRRTALGGEPADKVAADLGMTPNAVFIARSRVLSRLRQEGAGLIDC